MFYYLALMYVALATNKELNMYNNAIRTYYNARARPLTAAILLDDDDEPWIGGFDNDSLRSAILLLLL